MQTIVLSLKTQSHLESKVCRRKYGGIGGRVGRVLKPQVAGGLQQPGCSASVVAQPADMCGVQIQFTCSWKKMCESLLAQGCQKQLLAQRTPEQ